MSLGFFCDKNVLPSENEVVSVLGETGELWAELRQHIEKIGDVKDEWRFYTKKAGWCKKLILVSGKEERNLIFLYPNIDYFVGVMVFGEKAVEAVKKCEIPEDVLNNILSTKIYAEGRSFNIEIRKREDFELLKMLIDIKIQN